MTYIAQAKGHVSLIASREYASSNHIISFKARDKERWDASQKARVGSTNDVTIKKKRMIVWPTWSFLFC